MPKKEKTTKFKSYLSPNYKPKTEEMAELRKSGQRLQQDAKVRAGRKAAVYSKIEQGRKAPTLTAPKRGATATVKPSTSMKVGKIVKNVAKAGMAVASVTPVGRVARVAVALGSGVIGGVAVSKAAEVIKGVAKGGTGDYGGKVESENRRIGMEHYKSSIAQGEEEANRIRKRRELESKIKSVNGR